MKVQYCSDLHLEFYSNAIWLDANPIQPMAEILLVAGDTHHLGPDFGKQRWFDYASENWEYVFLIPGNHEFYGGYDSNICLKKGFELQIRDNVYLLNNIVKEIENVRIICSTMWSKIERHGWAIERGMNDFRLINVNGNRLNIESYNQLFDACWSFLEKEINTPSDKTNIVVTHHLPSELCNLDVYKGSELNEAFCIDLTEQIEKSKVDFWIYGHSHGNVSDFQIGNTMMLTNQLGYIGYGEHEKFNRKAVFEV